MATVCAIIWRNPRYRIACATLASFWACFAPLAHAVFDLPAYLRTARSGDLVSKVDGKKIHYEIFEDRMRGSTGSVPVVISVGRSETTYFWAEFAHDLAPQGFGPFYVTEHRSQGRSDRVGGRNVSTVKRFSDYVSDFDQFMEEVVTSEVAPSGKGRPLLIAHSMGGTIVARSLINAPYRFDRAVFVAPMLALHSRLLPMKPSILRHPLAILRFLGLGHFLTFDTSGGRHWDPESRYGQLKNFEKVQGDATPKVDVQWLDEALKAMDNLRKQAPGFSTDSLVIMASKDNVVDNRATQAFFCAANAHCELVKLDTSHPIHIFDNQVRRDLLERVAAYGRGGVRATPPSRCLKVLTAGME